MRPLASVFVAAFLVAGCLDPLYSEGTPVIFSERWVDCCTAGRIDTCLCPPASSCLPSYRACAAGTCAQPAGARCGSFGGGSDAGTVPPPMDAGAGYVSDAGTYVDAGSVFDAGLGVDGGAVPDAGSPFDAGVHVEPEYEPCCVAGRMNSCLCPDAACSNEPLTPCPGAACIAGTRTGRCG